MLLIAALALALPIQWSWAQDQPASATSVAQVAEAPDGATPPLVMKASATPTPAPPKASRPGLDLAAPDIRKVMPASALSTPLADPDDPEANVPPETVQVQGAKTTPDVPGGILSVFWALWHPTQAWRIIAPVQ